MLTYDKWQNGKCTKCQYTHYQWHTTPLSLLFLSWQCLIALQRLHAMHHPFPNFSFHYFSQAFFPHSLFKLMMIDESVHNMRIVSSQLFGASSPHDIVVVIMKNLADCSPFKNMKAKQLLKVCTYTALWSPSPSHHHHRWKMSLRTFSLKHWNRQEDHGVILMYWSPSSSTLTFASGYTLKNENKWNGYERDGVSLA